MTAAPGPIQSGLDHYLRDHPVDRCVRVVVVGTARGALGAAVAQLRERWTTVAACADVAKEAPWWVLAAGQRTVALLDCRADATPTSSLVTAAATAHHALVVVGLEEGLTTAVRRQVHLVSLVGEARLTLVVGRADGGGFDQASVDRISADFTAFATKLGRDVAATVTVTMLADYLAAAEVPQQPVGQPLRLRVDPSTTALSTATPSGAFTGTLLAGRIGPGDLVRLVPGGSTSTVVTAELAADSRTVTGRLAEGLAVAAGQLMCAGGQPAEAADQFEAHVVWFADQPMLPGRPYVFRSAGGTVGCGTLAQPKYRVNLETLDQQPATKLELDEVGVCNLALDQPIAFDPHGSGLGTGQLTILDRQTDETVGVALIHFALRRAHNVHWQATTIDKAARQTLNGHGSAIVWFTGLSGSGKSAIANAVERRLHQLAVRSYLLDGDNVRHGLNRDLGFTAANRIENVRRVAEVAVLMADAGLVVLTALISPFSAERRMARERAAAGEFFEVFVDTPLAVAEQRDAKGLYAKARRGELTNFTGIDSPYEAPEHAEIVIDTMTMTVDEAAELVVAQLAAAGVISG